MIPENALTVSRDNHRSRWIRLRTMILLRWVAILGQSAAVLVALQFYNLRIELDLIIFASFPSNPRPIFNTIFSILGPIYKLLYPNKCDGNG